MKYPKSWKTNGHISTVLHRPYRVTGPMTPPGGALTPFSLDVSVYVEQPGKHGAVRRIVHTFTDLATIEQFLAELTRHIETWRADVEHKV